jgi:hypothetical protein
MAGFKAAVAEPDYNRLDITTVGPAVERNSFARGFFNLRCIKTNLVF